MSCLYSSPEVERTKKKPCLGTRGHDLARNRLRCGSRHCRCRRPSRSTKKRSPPASTRRRTLFNSAQFSCVGLQAQIRLSFALRSRAAQLKQPSRSTSTSVLEPLTGVALALENRISDPLYAGVLHRCCDRKVVVPGGYSKSFLRSNRALGRHFSTRNSPKNARQVGFRPAVHR
jgi:hypothetical protein